MSKTWFKIFSAEKPDTVVAEVQRPEPGEPYQYIPALDGPFTPLLADEIRNQQLAGLAQQQQLMAQDQLALYRQQQAAMTQNAYQPGWPRSMFDTIDTTSWQQQWANTQFEALRELADKRAEAKYRSRRPPPSAPVIDLDPSRAISLDDE